MSVILLILGILVTGAGVVTIGFGIPINEFNLGNTMMVAGTTAVAAGRVLSGPGGGDHRRCGGPDPGRPGCGSRPTDPDRQRATAPPWRPPGAPTASSRAGLP